MRPLGVVVLDPRPNNVIQLAEAEADKVIEALASACR